jgi:hypothetical protein
MEGDVKHLLIEEIDIMIARAQQRAEQHGLHIAALQGDARRQRQLALNSVQHSLDRLRTYRQALLRERLPGPAHSP